MWCGGAHAFDLGSQRFGRQNETATYDRGPAGGFRDATAYHRAMTASPQWTDALIDPTRPRSHEKPIRDAIRDDIGENL
jgi:hypothetical protein